MCMLPVESWVLTAHAFPGFPCWVPADPVAVHRCPCSQLMLRSQALELTLDSCLSDPLQQGQDADLARLLVAFLPGAPAAQVAAATVRLAALLSEDPHSYDTGAVAHQALRDVVTSLKAAATAAPSAGGGRARGGGILEAWTSRLTAIDRDLARASSSSGALGQQGGASIAK